MELCIPRAFTNLPHKNLFTQTHTLLRWKKSLPLHHTSISRYNKGLRYYPNSYLKSLNSTTSEETSTGASEIVKEEADGVVPVVDAQSVEKNDYEGAGSDKDDSSVEDQMKPFEFLDNLNLKLDLEKDTYSIILYGGGSLFALWLTAAVVGAIDSVPIFPKLMEIVGLSYTLWFTSRYLLFKKNRDELFAKIEEIKQEVIGSDDD